MEPEPMPSDPPSTDNNLLVKYKNLFPDNKAFPEFRLASLMVNDPNSVIEKKQILKDSGLVSLKFRADQFRALGGSAKKHDFHIKLAREIDDVKISAEKDLRGWIYHPWTWQHWILYPARSVNTPAGYIACKTNTLRPSGSFL